MRFQDFCLRVAICNSMNLWNSFRLFFAICSAQFIYLQSVLRDQKTIISLTFICHSISNLRSGLILAVLIQSLLRHQAKIGPDTKSQKLVLAAARFCPQRWLAVRTMPQDLIGCWNYSLRGCSIQKSSNDPQSAERRSLLSFGFFTVLW